VNQKKIAEQETIMRKEKDVEFLTLTQQVINLKTLNDKLICHNKLMKKELNIDDVVHIETLDSVIKSYTTQMIKYTDINIYTDIGVHLDMTKSYKLKIVENMESFDNLQCCLILF